MSNDKQKSAPAENQPLNMGGVSCWAFNLNQYIMVKILDQGYEHMAKNHNSYLGRITNWEKRTAEYYKNKADENGYTKFQAWCFISEFGEVCQLGMHGYFDTNIRIEAAFLSPCS